MPPKRKAAAKGKAAGGKKAKTAKAKPEQEPEPEPEAGPSSVKEAMEALKKADAGKKKTAQPDKSCPIAAGATVVGDYDCMLNQTNIGANNNKYYVIQVLNRMGTYYSWNRWGRVGEPGQNALKVNTMDGAIADFKKKFKDKTKNDWDKRDNFQPASGKYTLLEMGDVEDEATEAATAAKLEELDEADGPQIVTAKCTLDNPTKNLVKLIFDNDMFKEAMKSFDIDVKKMPLGKLSKAQIAKGFDVLEEIEESIKKKKGQLNELTSRFYTLIPHNFGRQRPPVINDLETVRNKMDMLLVLGDIEMAQSMQKDKKPVEKTGTKEVPHPFDEKYKLLFCDLEHLDPKEKEFKIIDNYLKATDGGGWRKLTIQDVWKVNRHGEGDRFAEVDKIGNRKLLWHGTNVAVVAAILKSGLRIMPHSGGRVGKGIYFASENSKSAGYVRCAGSTGIMFLNEVALGKEHHISRDDWTLVAAPKGYDSIIAKGRQEPDPKKDTTIKIESKTITVPQGNPVAQSKFSGSSFSQSEYLVYKENQARMRYLLKLKFG